MKQTMILKVTTKLEWKEISFSNKPSNRAVDLGIVTSLVECWLVCSEEIYFHIPFFNFFLNMVRVHTYTSKEQLFTFTIQKN